MTDIDRVASAIKDIPDWASYPGGWPNQIEAALVDAVLSIRARYGTETSGVRASIKALRAVRGDGPLDDLAWLARQDTDELAAILRSRQKLGGHTTKATAVVQAARNLVEAGVSHASELEPDNATHRGAYTKTRGLGPVTWAYFTMLLGDVERVKADMWVTSFVARALGSGSVSADAAEQLLIEAASRLGVQTRHLDHVVWAHERRRK